MAHIEYSEIGDSPLQRLLGHNQEVLKKWDLLLDTFYQFSSFDPQLQEEVRRAIAYQIGCAQCMSFGCPSQIIEDPKIYTMHFKNVLTAKRKPGGLNIKNGSMLLHGPFLMFKDPELSCCCKHIFEVRCV